MLKKKQKKTFKVDEKFEKCDFKILSNSIKHLIRFTGPDVNFRLNS